MACPVDERRRYVCHHTIARVRKILANPRRTPEPVALSADFEHLRWFWLPHEVPGIPTTA